MWYLKSKFRLCLYKRILTGGWVHHVYYRPFQVQSVVRVNNHFHSSLSGDHLLQKLLSTHSVSISSDKERNLFCCEKNLEPKLSKTEVKMTSTESSCFSPGGSTLLLMSGWVFSKEIIPQVEMNWKMFSSLQLNSLQSENTTLRWQTPTGQQHVQGPFGRHQARGGRAMSMYETGSTPRQYPHKVENARHEDGVILQPFPTNVSTDSSMLLDCHHKTK